MYYTKENLIGFSKPEAFKMLISPECEWRKAFSRLNSLDYVVRDLAFAGTLGIQVDVDGLISAADQKHTDWELLKNLTRYLTETLYENIQAQTASILYQRALADLLIKKKLSLENLFGIYTDLTIDDNSLAKLLKKRKAGREVFDEELRTAWRAWNINTFVNEKKVPSEAEKEITGQSKSHLTSHTTTRVTCLRFRQDHAIGLAMCHRDQTNRPAAKVFVKLCRSILIKQYPRLIPQHLTIALYEGLVDKSCEHGLQQAIERYAKLDVSLDVLKKAAEVVNKREAVKMTEPVEFSFRIGSFDYPFRGDPQEMEVNVMHAALMGDETVSKNIGLSVKDAAKILWSRILNWQSVYFSQQPRATILKLIEESQAHLYKSVLDSSATAEADLELYTLLEALKHPLHSVSFRISLPNLKLLNEDKTIENEYDVVSVVLKEDKHVEVWIWGVTTEADIGRKRTEDQSKIQKLKDHLGSRWSHDIKMVTNYVHKDGDKICCEIDGRQERR